jgi:glucose/arabinose dehydrogenase
MVPACSAMVYSSDGKLYIAEQAGTIEVWQDGTQLQANLFADTPLARYNTNNDTGRVDTRGARGLLGVTLHPDFANNHYIYVYYTAAVNPDGNLNTNTILRNRLSRFTLDDDNELALADSEEILLEMGNLTSNTTHNGGALHFDSDGQLYVTVGDNRNANNAQTLKNLKGKILRLNDDGSIPTDNPFYNRATGKNRAIWALGLRNPFTFAIQPGTDLIFINDVGQQTWEEINRGEAGANYGWPKTEGRFSATRHPEFNNPFYAYRHGTGAMQGFAITGGVFYNPAGNPTDPFPTSFTDQYFFADYVNGWIKTIDPDTKAVTNFATAFNGPVDLDLHADGSLLVLSRLDASVYKITYNP